MAQSVRSLFAAADLEPAGHVSWGAPIPERGNGVYVVSLSANPDADASPYPDPVFNEEELAQLMERRQQILLDGNSPSMSDLMRRFSEFWLPDEHIIYIGLATSLRNRVKQYYRTPIGARKPHAGGWWLKSLSNLPHLFVHFAPTTKFKEAEEAMLKSFSERVTTYAEDTFREPDDVMPFANLRGWHKNIKPYGISGATGEL